MNRTRKDAALRLLCAAAIFAAPSLALPALAAELSVPAAAPLTLPALSLSAAALPAPSAAAPAALPDLAQMPPAPIPLAQLPASAAPAAAPQASAQAASRAKSADLQAAAARAFWDGADARGYARGPLLLSAAAAAPAPRRGILEGLGSIAPAHAILPESVRYAARVNGVSQQDAEAAMETLRQRHQLARLSNGIAIAVNLDAAVGQGTKALVIQALELLAEPSAEAKARALVAIQAANKVEEAAETESQEAGLLAQLQILYVNIGLDAFRALAAQDKESSVNVKRYLNESYMDPNHDLDKPFEFVARDLDKLALQFSRRAFSGEEQAQDLIRGAAMLKRFAAYLHPQEPGTRPSRAASSPAPSGKAGFEPVSKNDDAYEALYQYGTNITALASEGRLDPMIGRRKELRQVLKTLMRRQKNNPVIIGEGGVGKTALVEGLAQLIANGKLPADGGGEEITLPPQLAGKNIFRLNLTALVAGTKLRGEFEERVQKVLAEVTASQGKVVLFIDEIHNVLGAGSGEGANDLSQALLEAMARPGFSVIGATTLDEYRKIEKKGAFKRRLNSVFLEAPSQADAVAILKGLRATYEKQHKVTIPDETISYAVKSAARYITDRRLPDSAIDLVDDAATEVELKAAEAGRAGQEGKTTVTVDDIAREIALRMDIPASNLNEDDRAALHALPEKLQRRVAGQPEAIQAVVRAVRKGRLGYKDPNQPDAFLFLGPTGVGKTELAKTLAKVLFGSEKAMTRIDMSEFGEKHNVSRLIGSPPGYVGYGEGGQLTEPVRRRPYQVVLLDEIDKAHPDALNVLLQAIEDGRLTDGNGRTVDFKNVILIMTANYLGAHSATAAKKNPIGFIPEPEAASAKTPAGDAVKQAAMKRAYLEDIKSKLRPETFNRIGERRVIVFNELKRGDLEQIMAIKEGDINERLADKRMTVKLSEAAKRYLVDDATSEKNRVYGARPLKQAIEEELMDALAEAELAGTIKNGDTVNADYDGTAKRWLIAKATPAQ